ncbi:uncharacterized protein LOC143032138 [Oratosquilla oratoria]|uniref:uncharacterized protein LOC143032138 n=1 Tax=Oratosquilla oratoria TaxID=337810 RepID=UPI003F762203
MFHFIIVTLAVSAAWAKPGRIFEDMATSQLQDFLRPFDPFTVSEISDAHIATDHTDVMLSATDVVLTGLSLIEVTELQLALPGLSKKVKVAVKIPELDVRTDNFHINGVHDYNFIDGSGSGYVTFRGVTGGVSFDTDKVGLSPIKLCISPGSMVFSLENTSIEGHLDGLDLLNAHISDEVAHVVADFLDKLNAETEMIEDLMNVFFCN